jgi:hypothetical protein
MRGSMADAALRTGAFVAALLAAGALALVIAYWTWQLIAPAPVHIVPEPAADPAAVLAASGLFGTPGAQDAGAPATESLGDVHLLGIVAQQDGAGYALFRLPEGARLVATGQVVSGGLQLTRVGIDSVTLRGQGGERILALRSHDGAPDAAGKARAAQSTVDRTRLPDAATVRSSRAAAPAVGRSGSALAGQGEATPITAQGNRCQPPAGFKGDVVRLNVELVGGLIAQPDAWRALVQPANGALVVKETGGFSQMVGLQQGDRIEQANGIALDAPDDVVTAVLRPLAANQSVRLSGKRNGQPREVWIANAGCVS